MDDTEADWTFKRPPFEVVGNLVSMSRAHYDEISARPTPREKELYAALVGLAREHAIIEWDHPTKKHYAVTVCEADRVAFAALGWTDPQPISEIRWELE